MNSEHYTYNQVESQLGNDDEPTILIRRSSGGIQPARISRDWRSEEGPPVARFTDENGDARQKPIQEAAASDGVQEYLADELARSADRSDAVWDRHEGEGAREQAALGRIEELVHDYYTRNNEMVANLLGGSSEQLRVIDELAVDVNHLLYGSMTKESFVQRHSTQLAELSVQMNEGQEMDDHLMLETRRLQGDVEAVREESISGDNVSQDGYRMIRKVSEVVDELVAHTRVLGYADDDASEALSKTMRLLDELQQTNWGSEAIVAELRHSVDAFSDACGQRYRRLSWMQGEMASMDT